MKLKIGLAWTFAFLAGATSPLSAAEANDADRSSSSITRREIRAAGVVQPDKINVRGQPGLKGEVVTQLSKGDPVEILEELSVPTKKADEPDKWYRIVMPTNTPVWVHASFIDPATKTVLPKKLNLRSGPGENHSIVGHLEKGEEIKEISTKESWIEIFAPTNAHGYVAAQLIKADLAAANPVAVIPPTNSPDKPVDPAPVPVSPNPAAVIITNELVKVPAADPVVAPVAAPENVVVAVPIRGNSPMVATPPPKKRIVIREGVVKRTVSIQAPTYYELESKESGRIIVYLHPKNPELKLKPFQGARVFVTGEEYLDERWPRTPILDIDTIELP